MEIATLFAQTLVTACLAAWMTLAVKDNIRHPSMNLNFVALVLQMERLAELYPDDFKLIAHRRIVSPSAQRAIFRLIVFCEAVATVLLWVGAAWLACAIGGVAEPQTARAAQFLKLMSSAPCLFSEHGGV